MKKYSKNERFNVHMWTNSYGIFFSFDKDAMTVSVFVTSSSQLTSYNQYFLL